MIALAAEMLACGAEALLDLVLQDLELIQINSLSIAIATLNYGYFWQLFKLSSLAHEEVKGTYV